MSSYYHIGLSLPGLSTLKKKVRAEAEAGARAGVNKEIPHVQAEVRRKVLPLVLGSAGLSLVALLVALRK